MCGVVFVMNFSLKYSLSAFTGSGKFHVMLTEILETNWKLDIILYFKETWIRLVFKKTELNKYVMFPLTLSQHIQKYLCVKCNPSLNRTPWNESLVSNWRNHFEKGFRTVWFRAETSGRDEPREPCPTVELLFMHFMLPEAAKECSSVCFITYCG